MKNVDVKKRHFIDKSFPTTEELETAFVKIAKKTGIKVFPYFEDDEIQNCLPYYIEAGLIKSVGKGFADIKDIDKEVTHIYNAAFQFNDSITSVDLSTCTKLTSIENSAFSSCDNLISINLSGCINLTTIKEDAFSESSNLTTITLSSSVQSIFGDSPSWKPSGATVVYK